METRPVERWASASLRVSTRGRRDPAPVADTAALEFVPVCYHLLSLSAVGFISKATYWLDWLLEVSLGGTKPKTGQADCVVLGHTQGASWRERHNTYRDMHVCNSGQAGRPRSRGRSPQFQPTSLPLLVQGGMWQGRRSVPTTTTTLSRPQTPLTQAWETSQFVNLLGPTPYYSSHVS